MTSLKGKLITRQQALPLTVGSTVRFKFLF